MYQIHCNREVSPLESHSILQRPFDLSLFLSFCKSSLTQFTPAAELLPVSGLEVAECRVLGSLFAQQDADVYHLTLTSAPGRGCLQALAQCLAARGKDTALAVLETPGQTSWRLALVRQATPRHCPPVLEGLLPVRCTALLCGSPRPNDALTPRLLRRICGCETVHQLRRAQEEDGLPRKLLFERCRTAWEQLSLALEDSTLLPSERSALPSLLVFQLTVLVLLEQRGIFGKDYPLQRWCSNAVLQGKNLFTSLLAPLLDGLSQGGDLPSLGLSGLPRLGELFAPWQGSAWRQENLMLPNRLFYDGKGNGFLEQLAGLPFDWNPPQADARLWAVNADDLGSVLERLLSLEETDGQGLYFTPAPVVNYLCRRALAAYLEKHTALSSQDCHDFCFFGKELADRQAFLATPAPLLKRVERCREEIDAALAQVTAADPCVGGGAFCVTLLEAIAQLRNLVCTAQEAPSLYRHAAEHSICGADIDGLAVRFTRGRLLLAVYLAEENSSLPEFLPVLWGNSLADRLEPKVPVYDPNRKPGRKRRMKNAPLQTTLTPPPEEDYYALLAQLQRQYEKAEGSQKYRYLWEMQRTQQAIACALWLSGKEEYREMAREGSPPCISWPMLFSQVYRSRDGFDLVVANPPYVGEKGHRQLFARLAYTDLGKRFAVGKMDLFYYFFHLALDITNPQGVIAMITTNYFVTATAGKKLRQDLKERGRIRLLMDFHQSKVFEDAQGQHNLITVLDKPGEGAPQSALVMDLSQSGEPGSPLSVLRGAVTQGREIPLSQLYEGENLYIQLRQTPPLLEQMVSGAVPLGQLCHINLGCHIVLAKVTARHCASFSGDFQSGDGVYVLQGKDLERLQNLNSGEQQRLVPYYKNSNVLHWQITPTQKKLIYLRWEDDIADYPHFEAHLKRFLPIRQAQQKRYAEPGWPWYAIHRPRETFLFEPGEKLVTPYRSRVNRFAYTAQQVYGGGDLFFVLPRHSQYPRLSLKYLAAVLNSKLMYFWLWHQGKRKGELLELYAQPLGEIPIRFPEEIRIRQSEELVDAILQAVKHGDSITKQEEQLEQLVHAAYGLTPEQSRQVLAFYQAQVPGDKDVEQDG